MNARPIFPFRRFPAFLMLGLTLLTPSARAQDMPNENRPGILRLLPAESVTKHIVRFPGGEFAYEAKAGTLPIRDGKGETTAELFSIGYAREPREPGRPITFVFNGGPGAASAFLNLGALGPRTIGFASDGQLLPPPARLHDNPDTWLAFTDLVFVDPVGTGYSRTPDPEKAADFWGVDRDAATMAAFIRLFLARNDRTGSPVFMVGESYGGFRAARLAHELQGESGIAPSGVVMISPALQFDLVGGMDRYQPLPWVLDLPSFAAVELERQGVRGAASLAARLAEVERFAASDYLLDLVAGLGVTDATVAAMARFTGLPPATVREQNGRIPASVFIKEFRKSEGRVLSRYDGAVAGPDPEPHNPRPTAPDAILDRALPAWTAAFVGYVRQELGYRTDVTFRLIDSQISGRWDYGTTPQRQGYAGAVDELQEARALNPSMEVMIAQGYTDLVTPYFTSKYLIGQLPALAGAAPIDLGLYEGGHMMYMREVSRRELRQDAEALYERASKASATGDPG